MVRGLSVKAQVHEWTTVFSWMDHTLSVTESGIQSLISRNYKYIFLSKN
jgi:hypothetical protein